MAGGHWDIHALLDDTLLDVLVRRGVCGLFLSISCSLKYHWGEKIAKLKLFRLELIFAN